MNRTAAQDKKQMTILQNKYPWTKRLLTDGKWLKTNKEW